MSRREEQLEELKGFEALLECFSGSFQFDENADPLEGQITVDMKPLDERLTVYAQHEEDTHYRSVGVLSPCTISFTLPPDYPSVPPIISLSCAWMNTAKINLLLETLKELGETYKDQQMLYLMADAVREEACKDLGHRIRVDSTPYAVDNKVNGIEMLRLLVSFSEEAERKLFESECHDCEVCCENEAGSRCVRFNPCRHVFCFRCVETYFCGLLKSEAIRALECLSEGCSSLAAQEVVKKAIGDEEFERYEKILLERALGSMDDMAVCPRPTCGKYAEINPFNRTLGRCEECTYAFCVLCRRAYHGLEPCRFQDEEKRKLLEEYEKGGDRTELIKRAGGEAALEKMVSALKNDQWLSEHSKKCPKCKADIEKTHGCNKMKCSKCNTCFCWLCGMRLDGDPYKHFSEPNGSCVNRLFEGAGEVDLFDFEDDDFDDDDDYYDGEEMDDGDLYFDDDGNLHHWDDDLYDDFDVEGMDHEYLDEGEEGTGEGEDGEGAFEQHGLTDNEEPGNEDTMEGEGNGRGSGQCECTEEEGVPYEEEGDELYEEEGEENDEVQLEDVGDVLEKAAEGEVDEEEEEEW